jgi:hypothetical protein
MVIIRESAKALQCRTNVGLDSRRMNHMCSIGENPAFG